MKVAVDSGGDLSKLDWKPSETPLDEVITGLALRHGVKIKTGIVLDGGMVYLRQRPSELQRTHRDANNAQDELDASQGDFLERRLPGNRQYMNELKARIDQGHQKVMDEALAELTEALDAPIKLELLEQWTSFGGQVPQPDRDEL
jgi:hypothetical protein